MEKDLFEKNIAALKEAQLRLAASSESVRNEALKSVYDALEEKRDFIFAENGKDLESAKNNVSDAVMGRLKFDEKKLDTISVKEAEEYMKEGHFAPGSMLPKIKAMTDYVKSTGGVGMITDPEHIYDALYSDAGTKIVM